ncbi:hypothetical protein E4O03_07790 [Treponema sp. OMZ 792]|uniref:hypothetical protein n=1 Tax=Treponema sp. OMZ 792 TaxID=2563667 RepID=UPI0020A3D120|nr:hypothetical protein [Treponema sp. OMZ 792]UTC74148.1 hypothetical protein E4O03_07790 [Treponema sp. OMZ 792]
MGLMLGLGLTFGALGAGFSIFQGWNRAQEEQEEIRRRKEEERRMREAQIAEQRAAAEREINYAKSVFKIEQEDAFRKADDIWHQGERIDMRADLDETLTGRTFNLAIKQNNAQDESLLHQEQRGKQNFQNTQGSFKAALGTSGVRAGANSSEALLSQNEENFNQDLALMKKQRETQKEISLMSAFSSLKGGMFRIDEERDAANKAFRDSKQLRDDYSEGGRAVNLFNQKIANRRADLQGSIDLQNLGGFFKQQAMQRAYDRAEYSFLDGLTDLFGGFGSGWNFGTSIAGFANKWGGGSFGGGAGSFGGTAAALSNYQRKHRSPYMNMLK